MKIDTELASINDELLRVHKALYSSLREIREVDPIVQVYGLLQVAAAGAVALPGSINYNIEMAVNSFLEVLRELAPNDFRIELAQHGETADKEGLN